VSYLNIITVNPPVPCVPEQAL